MHSHARYNVRFFIQGMTICMASTKEQMNFFVMDERVNFTA